MNYILIGMLIAIVWKLVEFVYEIACELFYLYCMNPNGIR